MANEVTHPLEAKGVSLGESARDQHMWIFECETERILFCKIYVSFVQNDYSLLPAAKLVELGAAVTATAGCIGSRDEAKRGANVPFAWTIQFFPGGQAEVCFEWHGILSGAMNVREHRIERIAGGEVLDGSLKRFNKGACGHLEQFIRAIAKDDVFRSAAMQFGELFSQRLPRGIWIEAQTAIHGSFD